MGKTRCDVWKPQFILELEKKYEALAKRMPSENKIYGTFWILWFLILGILGFREYYGWWM